MKIRSLFLSALVATMFAACSSDNDNGDTPDFGGDVKAAYISISTKAASESTRTSSEDPGLPAESGLGTVYLVTFAGNNDNSAVLQTPSGAFYATATATGTSTATTGAIEVNAGSKYLLTIVNPNTSLLAVLNGMTAATTFADINAAITGQHIKELTGASNNDFTMINVYHGDPSSPSFTGTFSGAGGALVDISNNVKTVGTSTGQYATETAAKAAALAAKADVYIERLASKIQVTAPTGSITGTDGGTFAFSDWTIDVVNKSFYPYAAKTVSSTSGHTVTGGFYANSFYTEDPNYTTADGSTDIAYNKVDLTDGSISFAYDNLGWITGTGTTYAIENTTVAAAQKYENVTRVVVKGTYFPKDYTSGQDWFSFGGKTYQTLSELQTDYADAVTKVNESNPNPYYANLKAACEDMLAAINTQLSSPVTGFGSLTATNLTAANAKFPGGELLKQYCIGTSGNGDYAINWYVEGLCHYYYEIRHNNDIVDLMAQDKYGVVRNNWYSLSVNTVSGPGTPWYPDVPFPGPGDPDPKEDIDKATSFLSMNINVAPWIFWTTGMDL